MSDGEEMKYLVETSGNFMLIDQSVEVEIQHDRPTIVIPTAFIHAAAARGQLKILRNDMPEESNDSDFAGYWAEDQKLAVEAYLSKFSPDAVQDPIEPTPDPIEPTPEPAPAADVKAASSTPKPRRKKA